MVEKGACASAVVAPGCARATLARQRATSTPSSSSAAITAAPVMRASAEGSEGSSHGAWTTATRAWEKRTPGYA